MRGASAWARVLQQKIWLAIKNHHMKHHYQDPAKGFGVSTPLWDIIVGTNFLQNKNKKEINPQEN